MSPESNEYSYEVPKDVAPLHEVAQGLLGIVNTQEQASNLPLEPRLEREQYQEAWVIQKRQNHLNNLRNLTGRWRGTTFINGQIRG